MTYLHWLAIWFFCGIPLARLVDGVDGNYSMVPLSLLFAFGALQIVWIVHPDKRTLV